MKKIVNNKNIIANIFRIKAYDSGMCGYFYTGFYKNVFAEDYTPNWSEEIFVIKKIKNTVPWTYVINDLNGEEITGTFYGKVLQKIDQQEFRIEKEIKKKGDKLYVKWKGYDNSFNSWIDKKT